MGFQLITDTIIVFIVVEIVFGSFDNVLVTVWVENSLNILCLNMMPYDDFFLSFLAIGTYFFDYQIVQFLN